VQVFPTSLIERLLATLTNPTLVLVLMNVGVVAILIELSSPGGWVAGFIGVICLALSVYGLGILPVNWFGLVFIGLAFTLFILDIKAPTHGALTAAGVGSLIAGGLVLFNSPDLPAVQRVSVPLVVGSALITGGMFFAILLFAVRAQKLPVRTGMESLVGKEGVAVSDLSPGGIIHIGGENWSAQLADETAFAPKGARVKAIRIQGLTIVVSRVEE
jgi:membrane-bound serine protease (ClpP class)